MPFLLGDEMNAKVIDMTGNRYGRLTAICISGRNSSRGIKWDFMCECGEVFAASGSEVRYGGITECPKCALKTRRKTKTTHGASQTTEYIAWVAMKRRCFNKNSFRYSDYGGRGIGVCDRWATSFENFISDVGKKPSEKHTLDRIDVNGNYEPENCRWATRIEQGNNKRNNRIVTINGKSQTLSEAAREIGISESALRQRLNNGRSNCNANS